MCAAIAPVTLQAAAKVNASRIMVRSIGMCGLIALRCGRFGALHHRQHEIIDRQADQDMRRRPGKTGVTPADIFQSPGGQRPAYGRGKTRDQRDAGDGPARVVAIDAPERGEGRVVQAKSHADSEQQPGHHQHRDRIAAAEHHQSRRQRQVGSRQHRPAADQIDLPADTRAEHCRNHQRAGERGKDPVRGNAEIAPDRIGQDRRQIIAGSPGQRLRGAERRNEGKLALAHGLRAIVVSIHDLSCCRTFASVTQRASSLRPRGGSDSEQRALAPSRTAGACGRPLRRHKCALQDAEVARRV